MNNELLLDERFLTLIKNSINDIKQTYAASPYSPNYVKAKNKALNLTIGPSLFWETLLVTLRGIIIRYARNKKRQKDRAKRDLEQRIKRLDTKVCHGKADIQDFETLDNLNRELINLRIEDLIGAYIRSRAESLEFGENPSKFFLNLENQN